MSDKHVGCGAVVQVKHADPADVERRSSPISSCYDDGAPACPDWLTADADELRSSA